MKTRRIVSLFIAVFMILTALPLTFMTVAADETPETTGAAPATLPNGSAYTTAPLFAEEKVITASQNKGWQALTAPDALGSHKGLNEGVGLMFKVDASEIAAGEDVWTAYGAIRGFANVDGTIKDVAFMFNAGAIGWLQGSTQNNPEGFVSTWYYSVDGVTWNELSSTASSFPTVANREEIYFYIPYSSMICSVGGTYLTNAATTAANVKGQQGYSFAEATEIVGSWTASDLNDQKPHEAISFNITKNAMGEASVTDVSFVYEAAAPATLPDGSTYTTKSVLAAGESLTSSWSVKAMTAPNAPTSDTLLNDGLGVMFKLNSTVATAGVTGGVRVFANVDGKIKDTILMFSPSGIGCMHGSTSNKPAGATSVWYTSVDGVNWKEVTATHSYYMDAVEQAGVTYVYVPLSSMYVSVGGDFFTSADATATTVKGQPAYSYAEATEIVGSWTTGTMAQGVSFLAESGVTMSDLCFVYKTPAVFATESVTLTDDLSYNIYANVPADAENVKMTFAFAGETVEAEGVVQPNGMTKYTLANILPQQMGEKIVATWTATIGEEEVTQTYTNSVAAYAKALIGAENYGVWRELAKALLHYGAAAQAYNADPEAELTLVNAGVDAVTAPVDVATIDVVYTNGDLAVWTGAALRLDGAINLKVKVSAPAGVTQAQYTLDGKTAVVDIVDGYVYIPVYAYQFMDAISIVCYDGAAATGEALEISASWYLANKDTTDNEALANMIAAIANYAAEAAKLK